MRTLLGLLCASICLLARLAGGQTDSPPAPPQPRTVTSNDPEAVTGPVAVPEPTAKAMSYYHSGMVWWGVRLVWGFLVPLALLFSGASAWLRTRAQRLGGRWCFEIALYALGFVGLIWLLDLPFEYLAGYVREHAYGLSNQSFGKWLGDACKGLLVSAVLTALVLWVPYRLLRQAPHRWWLITSAGAIPFMVLLQLIQPIWIDPLFNRFGPMEDRALEADILALAERAGIEGSRVFQVDKSVDTKAVNAYVTGFLDTKRIVLWDTLLVKLARDEVLFVMGHEMGHYVLGHVWTILGVLSTVVLVTLYAAHRGARALIGRYHRQFGFTELADVASLPLLLLFFQLSTFVLMPFINTLSRHHERESDRFGLELLRNNRAASMAFVKLQHENLGNPRPGWVHRLWRASHPSLAERIEFCNAYRPWAAGAPLRYADRMRVER